MNKIKKGDEVIVTTGKDKGKKGTVLSIVDGGERLLVDGINLAKKHVKANPNTGDRGGVIPKSMSIHRSNVMVFDPTAKKEVELVYVNWKTVNVCGILRLVIKL